GLPNRLKLTNIINKKVITYSKENKEFALMFLDLDRFKNINDTLGHAIGDQLLKAVGERLMLSTRPQDIVSRIGGDEYVILLPNTNKDEVKNHAEHILKEMGQYFVINNIDVYISPSIGISIFPEDGQSSDILIKNADTAMYYAKRKGKNNFQFFNK